MLADQGPAVKIGKNSTKNLEAKKTNKMAAEEISFEFKKTSRHEAPDSVSKGVWDKFGRFFVSYGVRKPGLFDKELRNIKFYSMFGDPLQSIEKIPQMNQFSFRPRPDGILEPKAIKALKTDYRKKYGKIYREEEMKERQLEHKKQLAQFKI